MAPPVEPECTEFFAPFAHVPGRFEWCRIRSPTHGVFDTFIVLGETTAVPCDVYVRDDAGEAFMAQRYPECRTERVPGGALRIEESDAGRVVTGRLEATAGPLRSTEMRFDAVGGVPREVPYGGTGQPVWGGRFTCTGVDLEWDARMTGHVVWADGRREDVVGDGIVTAGSMGLIEPLSR